MSKEDKRPKTLLEFMGFKDPDIENPTHDELINLITEKDHLKKILGFILAPATPNIAFKRQDRLEIGDKKYFYEKSDNMSIRLPCGSCDLGTKENGDVYVRGPGGYYTKIRCIMHHHIIDDENNAAQNPGIWFWQKQFILDNIDLQTLQPKQEFRRKRFSFLPYNSELIIKDMKTEKHLADNYHSFGFLDIWFKIEIKTSGLKEPKTIEGFIEVKPNVGTFSKELREIEYYKDKISRIRGWDHRDFLSILVSPTKIPEQFSHQITHLSIEKIKEIIR